MIRKFRDDIKQGDTLITYSQEHREYLVGEDLDQYEFRTEPEQIGELQHIRKVKWLGRVSRDQFSQATRNSLGSVLTVFSLSDTVISEVQDRLAGKPAAQPTSVEDTQTAEAEFEILREEVVSREARYEAERATIPVTLIDIDLLADLVVANYERFDIEGQRLLPLVKVYWPAE
jgi:restriction system protein